MTWQVSRPASEVTAVGRYQRLGNRPVDALMKVAISARFLPKALPA